MNHQENLQYLRDVDYLNKAHENHLITLLTKARDCASEMYQASTTINNYTYCLKEVDRQLYDINQTQKQSNIALMHTQIFISSFFNELKLIQFNFANKAINPIKINLSHKVHSAAKTEFFLSDETMNNFFDFSKIYYKTQHTNSELIEAKVEMIKNLEKMHWYKSYETVEKDYVKASQDVLRIKTLMEVEMLENVMTNQTFTKTTNKLKI